MRHPTIPFRIALLICCGGLAVPATRADDQLVRLKYRNPGLQVDLGVGLWAWPLPMDWDQDGDWDLVVVCPDKPYNGVYLFENPDPSALLPVFKPAVRISDAQRNPQLSFVDGRPVVTTPGKVWPEFRGRGFVHGQAIYEKDNLHPNRVRANQWKFVDYDGDEALDLIVGVGDWTDYGWDDAYDREGRWLRGPLRGLVYLLRNTGSTATPQYAAPRLLQTGSGRIEVFGMPSPNMDDFDGDGDLDLICGEFLDGFTYFENTGTRTEPSWAAGRRLTHQGQPLTMDLQMITPCSIDWDRDGHIDLVVGDEDGRVALVRHSGQVVDGLPQFEPPQYFQQQADDVKFGALVTPFATDWDNDGDEDLICGNTAGYIGFIENLDGGNPPRWAAPVKLTADEKTIRIQAGPNGSIQGPAEAKWGYTTLSVADWDHDGRHDVIVNSIWGKVVWFRNVGQPGNPQLTGPEPVRVAWPADPAKPAWNWWDPESDELATQWRTTPMVLDLDRDGWNDLVMLDHEGYLAFFQRTRVDDQWMLLPGRRVFLDADGLPLRLNSERAGRSGRRKLQMADWDGDGHLDLLANSGNVDWWRNVSNDKSPWTFANQGLLDSRVLAGHTTSPTVVDWNHDGVPELLVGAEDGFLYYMPRR